MNRDIHSAKIDAWLAGKLPPAEAQAFEAEIAADPELAAEVEVHRLEQEAIDELVRQDLERDMARWDEDQGGWSPPPEESPPIAMPKPRGRFPRRFWIGGLLLLLLAGAFWYLRPGQETPALPGSNEENVPTPVLEPPITQPPPDTQPVVKEKIPIAETTPPSGRKKKDRPDLPEPIPEDLFVSVDTDMQSLQEDIIAGLSPTKGAGDIPDVSERSFAAGADFFKSGNAATATVELLKVAPDSPKYADAQQMLAKLYFDEKNYRQAALCYERFAQEDTNSETKWRLVQFYLMDYPHQKANFWKKLNEMLAKGTAKNKARAAQLRDELLKRGISEN